MQPTIKPFRYHSVPWTVLYVTSVIPTTLFVRIPWYCLKYLSPSGRPRKSWPFSRALIVALIRVFCTTIYDTGFQFTTTDPTTDPTVAPKGWEKKGWVPISATSDKIQGELLDLAKRNNVDLESNIGGYWFGERGPDEKVGQSAREGEKVVLYFHSGGYVRVFSLEYHVAKSAPFGASSPWPTQLVEGVSGFAYLISLGFTPENIIVCGDSSGGHMAFTMTHYLLNHPEVGLGSPGGLLLLSPTMDFTVSSEGPDSSFEKNQSTDGLVALFASQYSVEALRGQMSAKEFAADPGCNPGSVVASIPKGFFAGMPKTFIHGCDGELALDSIVTFRDRMWEDNEKENVEYVESKDVTHDLFATLWQEPQYTELRRIVKTWLQQFETS
ncbi:alpha/beta-hydrolase [Calocera viscosa TUFC12733]|uniref:Alpha/beta-hydrolase n=1 Tax=Calocera viscosa (strain TUFC12733) TaxID=1330018 RepID=A0A167MVS2_CALVF|nr:alpha/beta-hydrolase [Calocera viscosa TUFC12733]